jgi:endonuclease YncB( thermonuclease family)
MGRLIFRLSLAGVALLALLAFLRPSARDEVTAPPAAAVPASNAQTTLEPAPAPAVTQDSEQRLSLRYEQETAPEVLRPPPLPERSPFRDKQRFYRVVVKSAGTLEADDAVIRLSGLTAPERDDTCPAPQGKTWPCGRVGQTALARLIRSRAIECVFAGRAPDGALLGRCTVAATDINEWVVRRGWARADVASTYAEALAAARQDGSGLWSKGEAQP